VLLEDLMQEGALALVQAVDHYDPNRGMKLSTYATWWVKQAIRRAAMAQRMVRAFSPWCIRENTPRYVSRLPGRRHVCRRGAAYAGGASTPQKGSHRGHLKPDGP